MLAYHAPLCTLWDYKIMGSQHTHTHSHKHIHTRGIARILEKVGQKFLDQKPHLLIKSRDRIAVVKLEQPRPAMNSLNSKSTFARVGERFVRKKRLYSQPFYDPFQL